MLTRTSVLAVLLLHFSSFLLLANARYFSVPGHIAHGVNDFNDNLLANYSSSSNIFSSFPPLAEIGVITPGGTNASLITENTPLSSIVATIDAFDFRTFLGFPPGAGPFNIPISQAPTFNLFSSSLLERVTPSSFESSSDPNVVGQVYLSAGVNDNVTVADWNRAAGRMTGTCRNGTAHVYIEMQNALPNGLFSMWDVGVSMALTPNESLSLSPFGGIPNVLTTDGNGRGSISRRLNYCPLDKCQGSSRCSLYLSMNYHFDHVVYGGAPTLDFGGLSAGQVAANQLVFILNGDVLIPVQNKFSFFLW
ncbi:hypothetical protein BWQ96_07791 [Gracilariopsis chorda]|uniref:Uncharacterized protein n=1 Tax=Gracilariopsis chorda TaxID=448386 RepID=A0A2V3IK75_9FLOR|nr:hypothetical protein BWQ96_07791 [Gracilariopsis chorda]|eukprot:PXF42482.1 hypothetical protein BWQ96_07791 [Gracilariopsis chorda]